ncbi:TetR/AcrR family transcriptional regulator [Rhizobium rhizogenes]|uniref:TetR/AcrR family transcriptional regulator n=1 Tax=Rhizobium rhizogenes TaxID=359 RepID=UPI002868E9E1|nr:TetR/AcrR family transcriptional regulator [Rhizobium rhizogenes]
MGKRQDQNNKQQGLREKNRKETLQRIAETGLKLFMADGYEATTLHAITQASGISRRTFFYYFKSKEEILLAWQNGLPDAVHAAILAEPTKLPPLDIIRNALLKLPAHYHSENTAAIVRIVRSSEQLRASSQAKYLHVEEAAFEALCERWPQQGRRKSLQILAIACVSVLRHAVDTWADEGGRKPLATHLKEAFENLKNELTQLV